jgi:hypothetical protein
VTWYVARGGGVLAYLLLSSSVVAGLLISGRARLKGTDATGLWALLLYAGSAWPVLFLLLYRPALRGPEPARSS